MEEKAIFISIKPKYLRKIEEGIKTHEFRNYIPKQDFSILYVYESSPVSSLKYIIYISKITKYPDKINSSGFGNLDFNNGLKKSKYAYEIKKVYRLTSPLPLSVLKEKYQFNPPQAFAYSSRYLKLSNDIKNMDKELIIDRI